MDIERKNYYSHLQHEVCRLLQRNYVNQNWLKQSQNNPTPPAEINGEIQIKKNEQTCCRWRLITDIPRDYQKKNDMQAERTEIAAADSNCIVNWHNEIKRKNYIQEKFLNKSGLSHQRVNAMKIINANKNFLTHHKVLKPAAPSLNANIPKLNVISFKERKVPFQHATPLLLKLADQLSQSETVQNLYCFTLFIKQSNE